MQNLQTANISEGALGESKRKISLVNLRSELITCFLQVCPAIPISNMKNISKFTKRMPFTPSTRVYICKPCKIKPLSSTVDLFANPVGCRPSPCKMRDILRFQAEVVRKLQFPNNSGLGFARSANSESSTRLRVEPRKRL
jgi:hypothetical protein